MISRIYLAAVAVISFFIFTPTSHAQQNVLLIIADDLGVEALGCYGIGSNPAPTPNIDRLCQRGVVFENFWSQSTCSPTRATILTGRYGFRTGIGGPAGGPNPGIRESETSLFDVLNDAQGTKYRSAVIGKWHLSDQQNGGDDNPARMGVKHYAGFIRGGMRDYFSWPKTVNGRTELTSRYATLVFVDDALDWIKQDAGQPWFLWLALTAPHAPFHKPPEALLSERYKSLPKSPIGRDVRDYYKAMIEAMDTEIGRLLVGIGDDQLANTNVIFIGDNGSPARVIGSPFNRQTAKDTLFEGGIRVPLVVAGPVISNGGRKSQVLVNSTDLFATILDLAGIDARASVPASVNLDSVSFRPHLEATDAPAAREFMFSDKFGDRPRRQGRAGAGGGTREARGGARASRSGTGGRTRRGGGRPVSLNGQTIRDDTFKLIRFSDGSEQLFNLRRDPFERTNLIAGRSATGDTIAGHRRLAEMLDRLLATK